MTTSDWDRLFELVIILALIWAFVRVMVLLFKDPSNAEEGLSPFKAWLAAGTERDKRKWEFELEKFRIDKNLTWGHIPPHMQVLPPGPSTDK